MNLQPMVSCKYWDKQGKLKSGPCFHQFLANTYFDYGFNSVFTIIVNPNFLTFSQGKRTSEFSLGYVNWGGRYSLYHVDKTTLSTQILFNQPFKSTKFGMTKDPAAQYAIANEEYYIDARLLYGILNDVTTSNGWYLDLEGAYRPYLQGAASELHFDFITGKRISNHKWNIELQELNTISLHDAANDHQPNYNLYSLQTSLAYFFDNSMSLQLGLKQDFYGNNTGRGTAPFIAFSIVI